MSNFARWERESQEPLGPPADSATRHEDTAEFEMGTVLHDPPEYDEPSESDGFDDEDGRPASLAAARQSLAETAGKVGRWFGSLDRRPEYDHHSRRDPLAELMPPHGDGDRAGAASATATTTRRAATEPADDPEAAPEPASRFPTAPLGYNRQAVDQHLTELEAELAGLRANVAPPVSITEEIERIGEQTASILVVAHDKAHETARLAQEQADRAVSEASINAQRITAEAQRRLRELDEETEAVWRERERLLEDVRVVSATLSRLVDEAAARFPADAKSPEAAPVPAAH